jgi:hypothetical protein
VEEVEQILDMPGEALQAKKVAAEAWPAELSMPPTRPKLGWVLLAFAGGLFLGWLLIGWWLWPVQWANASPWDLQRRHQENFVSLVAAQYWQSNDVEQAGEALAGWDDEALSSLLTTMESEAPSAEVSQQLTALREALALPEGDLSLWALLLRQRAILWSITLVLSVFCVAIGVAAVRRMLQAVRGNEPAHATTAEDSRTGQEEEEQAVLLEAFAEDEDEIESMIEDVAETGEEEVDQDRAESTVEIPAKAAEPAKPSEAAQTKDGGKKAEEAEKTEKAGAGSMMEMLARSDKPAAEEGLDLADIEVDEGLLADLFTAETNDARFEIIRPMLDEVDVFDLMEGASRVLSQLVELHRDHVSALEGARS